MAKKTTKSTTAPKTSPKLMSGSAQLSALSAAIEGEPGGAQIGDRDYVSSLARGLQILRAFSRTGRKMTLSQVASETGITRAATRRFLLTLVHEGYAATDGKYFDLTTQVLELGYAMLSKMDTWEIAKPFLERLSLTIEESVSATVLDGFDVVYVSCVQVNRIISVGVAVGNRFPASCTASGRVLLAEQPEGDWDAILKAIKLEPRTKHSITSKAKFRAELKKTQDTGYSLVDQELEIGLLSIAIPIRSLSGRTLGAVNVGVPSVRATPKYMVETILPALRETAAKITKALPS